MGRPRKPTKTLKVHGTFREDRHGGEEPKSVGALELPSGMSEQARWFWNQHIEQVKANGAGAGDLAVLLSACQWWSKYHELMAGDTTEYRDFIRMSMAWKNFDRAVSRLGLSPTDRAKLRIPGEKKSSTKSKYFAS